MIQPRLFNALLVAIVSVPGFIVGHKLRSGDSVTALMLLPVMAMIVFLASALMRQGQSD